mmetsp:Transcript_7741/g.21157  ORF Transcript_7741/g.21157 Transcript_7741/m.21157 type:complete len:293 (-) Transcript_7741:179-1057(-)
MAVSGECCAICQLPFGEQATVLECGHKLHNECINEMRRSGVVDLCPICRTPLTELRSVAHLMAEAAMLQIRSARRSDSVDAVPGEPEALDREALLLLEEARDLEPDQFESQLRLGEAYSRCGKDAAAQPLLRAALEKDPLNVEAHHLLGISLCATGEQDEGIAELQEAVRLDPEHLAPLLALGASYFAAGDFDNAQEHLRRAMQLRPNDFQAYLFMAQVLENRGKKTAAFAQAYCALQRNPGCKDAQAIVERNHGNPLVVNPPQMSWSDRFIAASMPAACRYRPGTSACCIT